MDNFSIPTGQPMAPVQPLQPAAPTSAPTSVPTASNMPVVQQTVYETEKDKSGLIKTILIVVLLLIALTFVGLFFWMMSQYNEAKDNVDGQISVAVAEAKDEQAAQLEAEFAEREKYPYKTFSGPDDYGHLSFEYPQTWSVYVEKAATTGGDFAAYLNPIQVDAVGKDTINALRVFINNKSFESTTEEYQRYLNATNSELTMSSVSIGINSNISANRYTGKIPNTELNGIIVIFKIRDKTAILQTDSVLFEGDFDKLLATVTFNE